MTKREANWRLILKDSEDGEDRGAFYFRSLQEAVPYIVATRGIHAALFISVERRAKRGYWVWITSGEVDAIVADFKVGRFNA